MSDDEDTTPVSTETCNEAVAQSAKRLKIAHDRYDPSYNSGVTREDTRSQYTTNNPLQVADFNDDQLFLYIETAMRETRTQLAEYLPYANGEDNSFPWIEEWSGAYSKCVIQVLIGMFTVWCKCAVGVSKDSPTSDEDDALALCTEDDTILTTSGLAGDDGMDFTTSQFSMEDGGTNGVNENEYWRAVTIYMPSKINGQKMADRERTTVLYRDPVNPSVCNESSTTIRELVERYVVFLNKFGVFTPGTVDYLVPPFMFPTIVDSILRVFLGDGQQKGPAFHGNIFVEDEDGGRSYPFSVETVGHPMKTRWAIGSGLLRIPKPIGRDKWESKILSPIRNPGESEEAYDQRVTKRESEAKKWLPQLDFASDLEDDDAAPYIHDCRHFKLDDDAQEKFSEFIRILNGFMHSYREYISETSRGRILDADNIQQWICDRTWELIHEFAPTFTSFLGAQYCQRTCVALQDPKYRDEVNPSGIGKPRSYYTKDPRYRVHVHDEERRVVGAAIDTAGMAIFSKQTYMCGFTGHEGSGKSLFLKLLTLIVGAPYILRLDKKDDKFSMGMYGDTFLIATEDQRSGKLDVSSDIRDGILGIERNDRTTINIRKMYSMPEPSAVWSVGGVMCRNSPPQSILESTTKSPIEKLICACLGDDGGDFRRGRAAPPLMVQLNLDTANPVDSYGNHAYDETRIMTKDNSEVPFILGILWFATTTAEVVRDPMYGLVGDDGNPFFQSLLDRFGHSPLYAVLLRMCARYLSMDKDIAHETCSRIMIPAQEQPIRIKHKLPNRSRCTEITMTPSVPFRSLRSRYYEETKLQLKQLPEHYGKQERIGHCSKCGVCIEGVRFDVIVDVCETIAADPSCTSSDKQQLVRICPKGDGTKRCIDNLSRAVVIRGYTLS